MLVLVPFFVLTGHLLWEALQPRDTTVSHVVLSARTHSRERVPAQNGAALDEGSEPATT